MSGIIEIKNKTKGFFKNYYGYFLAPAFVFVVFGLALWYFGIWPFGETIMSSYDHLAQVCPLLEHYFAVFDGTSGLFHSFFVGGGMDLFGSLAYCSISPFTFIFLLGGRGSVVNMISVVLPLKMACASATAYFFLKRYFKSIPNYLSTVLAVLYAYGGYLYVANTYVNWVDLMIYAPLTIAGFIEFIRTDKLRYFAIMLAIMIYTCFSIVCFSFFLLFPILTAYVLICVDKSERSHKLTKLCLGFAMGIALSLPLLVPSLFAFKVSSRNTGLFSEIFKAYAESDITNGKLVKHLYEKLTYVLCNSTFVFLIISYFTGIKKGDKFARFALVSLAILILPCLIEESMSLLNMGSTFSYTYRFGFLIDAYGLYMAATEITRLLNRESVEEDGTCRADKKSKAKSTATLAVICLLACLGIVVTCRLFFFILNGDYKSSDIVEKIMEIFSLKSDNIPFDGFFPNFAHSGGGLEAILILFAVVCVVFLVSAALIKRGNVKFREAIAVLCALSLSQCFFFNFSMVKGDRQGGSKENYDQYFQIVDQIDEIYGESYFKLKSYDYYISANSPLTLRAYSHSIFSSMADEKNLTVKNAFGYGGGTNSIRNNRGTSFSDALLSYKYEVFNFQDADDLSVAEKSSSLRQTDIYGWSKPCVEIWRKSDGKSVRLDFAEYDDFGFEGALPNKSLIFVAEQKDGYLTFKLNGTEVYSASVNSDVDRIKAIGNRTNASLYEFTVDGKDALANGKNQHWKKSGSSYVFESSSSMRTAYYTHSVSSSFSSAQAKMTYGGADGSSAFVSLRICLKNGDEYSLHVNAPKYALYENIYAFPSCAVVDGDTITFDENATRKEREIATYEFLSGEEFNGTSVGSSNIRSLQKKLESNAVSYQLKKNEIVLPEITAEKGQSLYLNYVNIDGYEVTVNGTKREMKENSLDFIIIELDEGVNKVEIKYKSPYYDYILLGVVLCLIVVAAYLVLTRPFKKVFEKAEKAISIAAVVFAAALVAFFILFPTCLFLYKFIFKYLPIIFA